MAKADTWMPFYIGDYLADTMHLSTVEHGAYILILMNYWRNGPPLDDDRILAGIAKMDRKSWAEIAPSIREFFVAIAGRLHQKRMDSEREKASTISAKRSQAASKRHASAEQVHSKSDANAGASVVHLDTHARGTRDARQSQSQLPSQEEREEPIHTPRPVASRVGAQERACVKDEFEEFWCNYPRKVGKGAARKAYLAAISKESHATILAKLQRYKWPLREQFIPHPATWLNSERWLDEQEQFDPVLRAMGIKPEDFDDETQGNAWKALLQ